MGVDPQEVATVTDGSLRGMRAGAVTTRAAAARSDPFRLAGFTPLVKRTPAGWPIAGGSRPGSVCCGGGDVL